MSKEIRELTDEEIIKVALEKAYAYAVYLQAPKGFTRQQMVDGIIPGFINSREPIPYPLVDVDMPCGNHITFLTYRDIPLEDIPCPCGNPKHWLVKYKED